MIASPRRAARLSLLAAVSGAAVVGALLVPGAAGAAVTGVTPSTGFNSEASKALTVTTDEAEGTDYRVGGSAVFTLSGTPSASFTVAIPPGTSARSPQVTVNLLDAGNGLGADGPVDAGTYDVATTATGLLGNGDGTDRGASRFTVQPAAALGVSAVTPGGLRAGQRGDITITGSGFERGVKVELLRGGTVDTAVTVGAPADVAGTPANESTEGITTPTQLRRGVALAAGAATGARDVRVTTVDGRRSAVCTGCFSVDGAPLTGTSPAGGDNDPALGPVAVTFTGTGLNAAGRPELVYAGAASTTTSPRDSLTVVGTGVRGASPTSITADFDLRNAAPQAYTPVVRNPDGSSNACECTFTVAQKPSRVTTVTALDSDTATAGTQNSQPQGSTQAFVLSGTGFSKGLRVTVSGDGVTAGPVEVLSETTARTTLTTTATAPAGARNVTVTRTDGTTSAPCNGCHVVTATASPTATPSPGSAPATPTVTVHPGTITSQQTATVSGTAQPGSTIELHAYSRPSTEYALVRSAPVDESGRWSFTVKPSGNTRLYARAVGADGSASPDSPSQVLSVRVGINLKVARTGERTYRFTGSTLPKRPGQLVTVFYENGGGRTIAVRTRLRSDGRYDVTRTFTGTGTLTFFSGTGKDLTNEAGESNRVRTTVR